MAEKEMATIPAGSLLTISTGEYSDYTISGVFRAKTEIDASALRDEWFRLHPEQSDGYRFREAEFLGWLYRNGVLESVSCFEWHITGCYRGVSMWVDTLESDVPT